MKQPTNGQPTLENTPVKQRGREYATMFAYGVPRRRAVRMIMIESTLIGTLATAVGVAGHSGS
jgi:ABC-type lipoprotein release transport system permease subunit